TFSAGSGSIWPLAGVKLRARRGTRTLPSRPMNGSGRRDRVRFDDVSRSPRMTRRNRLAELLRFYGDRPRAGDARDPVDNERDWIDVDAEDDGDGDPEAGLPLARTFGPGTRPLTWKEHL